MLDSVSVWLRLCYMMRRCDGSENKRLETVAREQGLGWRLASGSQEADSQSMKTAAASGFWRSLAGWLLCHSAGAGGRNVRRSRGVRSRCASCVRGLHGNDDVGHFLSAVSDSQLH